jgi:hypothetical protein
MILRDIEARRRKAMEVCFKYFAASTALYFAYDVFSHTGCRYNNIFISHIPQLSLVGDGVASRS